MDKYKFTTDWFSGNIPVWTEVLKELRGKPVNVLEIGSYQGRSAVWLLENILTHDDAHLTCIDSFLGTDYYTETERMNIWDFFEHNVIKNFPSSKVSVMKGLSGDVLRTMKHEPVLDFVYIDGSHYSANTMEDAVLTFPMLKNGGIMIFDDFDGGKPGEQHLPKNPKCGIVGFCNAYAPFIEIIHVGYQLVLRKKNSLGNDSYSDVLA